jgi:hypothetical protein
MTQSWYVKSHIPVHRYHFHSQLTPGGTVGLKRIKLDFGPAATLDMNRTWMLAVESLLVGEVGNIVQYALRITGTGYSSVRSNAPDVGNTATLLCYTPYMQGNFTRGYMGTPITNPDFLNSEITMELLDAVDLTPLTPADIVGFQCTFIVYEYVPN